MIPLQNEWKWIEKVTRKAGEHRWTVFGQQLRSQRQHEPTLILTKGDRVLLVWLRTAKPRHDRMPPMERYKDAGFEAYLWTPTDWAEVALRLLMGPRDDGPADRATA
jgi:hypothetical protein